MKSSMMAVAVAAAVAGCSTTGVGNMLASTTKTVEYYRVFDIKTEAAAQAVAQAAASGISRNVPDATVATPVPNSAAVQDQPGRFKMVDSATAAPGAPLARSPSCEGATWTARAAPRVRGGQDMNMIACLFPYKKGYHLDMYAVFTKQEGGWLKWPRTLTGAVMGTPEKWTEKAMLDVVQSIRDTTGAEVALVEANPQVAGTPWLTAPAEPDAAPAAPAPAPAPAAAAPAPAASATGVVTTPVTPAPSASSAPAAEPSATIAPEGLPPSASATPATSAPTAATATAAPEAGAAEPVTK
jgi:hypothetical protein